MSRGRRTATLLVMVTTGSLLVGCGTGDAQQAVATPVVIPGSSVTIGTESTAPAATPTPTQTPSPAQTQTPTDPPLTGDIATADDLFAAVGAAMGGFQTVHLSVGNATPPPVVEADHQYLGGDDDYRAEITAVPGTTIEVRRVAGTTYVRATADGDFVEVDPDDPANAGSAIGALPGWDVLGDLVAVLKGASDFAAGGPAEVDGTPVASYTFTVDAADVVAAAQVPDDLTGPVEVTFSVDATGLPVRVDQAFVDSGQLLRTDYSAWGAPVSVLAP